MEDHSKDPFDQERADDDGGDTGGPAGSGPEIPPPPPVPPDAGPPASYPGGTPWTPPPAGTAHEGDAAPNGAPFPAAPPPPRRGRGSIWLGIGISLAAVGLVWLISSLPTGPDAIGIVLSLWLLLPVVLLIGGIVLAVIPRTTRTGGGILIGMGAAVLIVGGVCLALIASASGGY